MFSWLLKEYQTISPFVLPLFQDIAEANFRTSSSRLLAAVMSALCNTSVKLTSILPIAYDGEVLLRSLVKQVSTENDSALAHRFPLLVSHMEKLSHVSFLLYYVNMAASDSHTMIFLWKKNMENVD